MKLQLTVSYPDKITRHQFGGDCKVVMAEGGEKSNGNAANKDLVVKRNSTECVLIDRQRVTNTGTTCNTTIKTYMNNSITV